MGIRIRTGGLELEVDDEAALGLLRERGLVGADAERWSSGGWRALGPAGGVPTEASSDPWDAWSSVDERAAEAALQRAVQGTEEEVAELPLAAVTPMPKPIIVARPPAAREPAPPRPAPNLAERPVVAPPAPSPAATPPAGPGAAARGPAAPAAPPVAVAPPLAVAPVPAIPPRNAPARPRSDEPSVPREAGQVFEFPERPRRRTVASVADEPTPLIRPWRVLGMILAGVLALGGLWAAAELTRPPTAPISTVTAPPSAAAAVDPLKETERRLRAVPLGDARPVTQPGHLEDAMTIELQKLGVRVVRVRAPVTNWTGRKSDDPAVAEVHVTFRSDGDLDADLGAIQLVVGRYRLAYTLDVPVVNAILEDDTGERATRLDADRALRFAQGRVGLSEAVLPGV
jgi:hypothetical protein